MTGYFETDDDARLAASTRSCEELASVLDDAADALARAQIALREHENANAPMWRRAREAVDAAATLLDAQPVPFRRVRA